MLLFFDTETVGLPKNYNAHYTDTENYPRIVQLAWAIIGNSNERIEKQFIIQPNGFVIPNEAAKVHGITTEIANEKGVNILEVLEEFNKDVSKCELVIGHNVDFDRNILSCEFVRAGYADAALFSVKTFCTMKDERVKQFVGIRNYYGYKWATLTELHQKLFNSGFDGAHDALNDVKATARCYFELLRIGII